MEKAFINWSGGKDAAFSLYKISKENTYKINYLLTTLSSAYHRISMHGVREILLDMQAREIGIPLKKIWLPEAAAMEQYNDIMQLEMNAMLQQNINRAIFGDIFLEDLKQYREKQLLQVGMKGVFPLWKKNSSQLLLDFLDAGFKAIIVCVNAKHLDENFAGKMIDKNFLKTLPANVDPCGENGEFHTFVFDGPIFHHPVKFKKGEVIKRTYPALDNNNCFKDNTTAAAWDHEFYFCDLLPG